LTKADIDLAVSSSGGSSVGEMSARETSTLLNNALLSAHFRIADKPGVDRIGQQKSFSQHFKPTSNPLGASLPRGDWIAQSLLAAAPQMP
jgi:hypothetical protein